MAAVYEAEHLLLARRVAIKVLHSAFKDTQEAVTRFHLEAHAAACIAHPNVREVQEAGKLPDGSPYMVMEYLEGCSLADRLVSEQRLATQEAIDVLCQVLSALDAAHSRGFIHRDIKPGNVFLARRGRSWVVKLLDFGASTTRGPGRLMLTGPGKVMGTPLYMAPEQVLGAELDHRVDLYACGALLFETLVGVPPFTGSNWCILTEKILHAAPPNPLLLRPDLPLALLPILQRGLAKDAGSRYQTAELFLAELEAVRRSV